MRVFEFGTGCHGNDQWLWVAHDLEEAEEINKLNGDMGEFQRDLTDMLAELPCVKEALQSGLVGSLIMGTSSYLGHNKDLCVLTDENQKMHYFYGE